MQLLPDPPISGNETCHGAIAQLGERLLCKQEVIGSIPIGSTSFPFRRFIGFARVMGAALLERNSDRTGASAPPLFNNLTKCGKRNASTR